MFERYNYQTKHWYKVHGLYNSQAQAKASQVDLYKNLIERKAISTKLSDQEIQSLDDLRINESENDWI